MRAVFVLSFVLVLLTGCEGVRRDSYVTADGYEQMSQAKTPAARLEAAREVCVEAGLPDGTRRFARCLANYESLDAAVLRARARAWRDRIAREHGLCIDPKTFAVARCVGI